MLALNERFTWEIRDETSALIKPELLVEVEAIAVIGSGS
jgi:hypothetical protein